MQSDQEIKNLNRRRDAGSGERGANREDPIKDTLDWADSLLIKLLILSRICEVKGDIKTKTGTDNFIAHLEEALKQYKKDIN